MQSTSLKRAITVFMRAAELNKLRSLEKGQGTATRN